MPRNADSASTIAAFLGVSRRLADLRFRAVTGHSILDEIHAVQIEHAKRLLENPNLKLTLIPALCGYDSNPFFMKLFHRKTGFTLHGWRQKINRSFKRDRP